MLCEDSGFPKGQKEYFRTEVAALLAESGMGRGGALFCLSRLWQYYDVGGHSMGRSLRSVILDKVMDWLRASATDEASVQKAKTLLSVLVAMHYDYEYINRQRWFDYQLVAMWDLPLRDRILVSAAAFALSIDDVPPLDEWDEARIFAFR
ncbi:MAG: hypothetical protein PHD04_04050 [Candidatus Pacebacteria bacterium]|nr:hypothetical protein [Candidatus Paceibacterota bacterium]